MSIIAYAYIDILVATLWERSMQHFWPAQTPVFIEVFIFLSRPDTSNSQVDSSTDGSSEIFAASLGSLTSTSKAYFLFKLHDTTSGESGSQ